MNIAKSIKSYEVCLDAEGICVDSNGRPVFNYFNNRLRMSNSIKIAAALKDHPATLIVHDILWDGHDITKLDIFDRKKRLEEILKPSETIMPVPYFVGRSKKLYDWTQERNFEGIVLKRIYPKSDDRKSVYQVDTRSPEWLKIKHFKTLDTVILGYRLKPQFGLLVGTHFRTIKNKPLCWVEFGFSQDEKHAFLKVAQQIRTRTEKIVNWVEPLLCARIKYLDRSENHTLRITSFVEFLPMKDPKQCLRIA